MTDRRTDGQTDGQNYDSQDRPRICSRGKNEFIIIIDRQTIISIIIIIITKWKTVGAAGLKRVCDLHDGEEDAARDDKIDDVVQRFTTKMDREYDATVRRLTTVVPHVRQFHRNVCTALNSHKPK